MTTPAAAKNTIITVPLTDSVGGQYYADVSSAGTDVGKIIILRDTNRYPVTYSAAQGLITDSENSNWTSDINKSLKAANLSTPGSPPKFNSANATIVEGNYTQQYDQNLNSILNNELNLQSTNRLSKAIAAQAMSPEAPVTTGVHIFPIDLIANKSDASRSRGNSQDCIRIKALKYTPPQEGFLESVPKSKPSVGAIAKFGMASLNQSVPKGMNYQGEVILPMPSEVRDTLKTEWGISDISALGFAMVGNIAGMQDPSRGPLSSVKAFIDILGVGANATAIGSLIKSYASGGPDLQRVIKNDAISSIISRIGQQVNPLDLLTRSTGKTVNANAELLFRAPSLRVFELNWKLSPRSAAEAQELRKIIRFLKVNMLPRITDGSAVLLQTPNVFVMTYERMDGSPNKSLPKPKICALTGFSADHTPDGVGWASYEDSHPVSTVLTTRFAELTPIFANEYSSSTGDDVGI